MYRSTTSSSLFKSPNFRLSLSLSLILLLHRLLFRFFSRLRSNLLKKDAAPFRRRNPRVAKSLTSRLAPAIGASLAGFALGIYPGDQLRLTIAIYVSTRSLEFAYNALDGDGWFQNRPWWWGSWMFMPLATGQLLHAFVFDRDCFPAVSHLAALISSLAPKTDSSRHMVTSFSRILPITFNIAPRRIHHPFHGRLPMR